MADFALDDISNGTVIFTEGRTIQSTDGQNTTILAGSVNSSGYKNSIGVLAQFSSVASLFILNSTSILAVDSGNHCLRLLDRITLRVTDFVGRCTYMGFKDGYGVEAEFTYPWAATLDEQIPPQTFYSLNYNNQALREVVLSTRIVKTVVVYQNVLELHAITWDYHNNSLIIATSRNIIGFTSLESTPVSEEIFRFTDKMLIYQIVSIYYDLYILSRKIASSLSLAVCDVKNKMFTPLMEMYSTRITLPLRFREHNLYAGMSKRIVFMTGMPIFINK